MAASSSSSSGRLIDAHLEQDLDNECVLGGVGAARDMSFDGALTAGQAVHGMQASDLKSFSHYAKKKAKRVLRKHADECLSLDEIAAVNLYTQECSLYQEMNKLLRERNRAELKPLFPYLKLLLTALHKLPPNGSTTVWRGVKVDLSRQYKKRIGDDIVWWGFSSATG